MRRRSTLLLGVIAITAAIASGCGEGGARTTPSPAPAARETTVAPADTRGASSAAFALSSEAVSGGSLLTDYRCEQKLDGGEASIPLSWSGVPDGTGSLAVVMYHYPFPGDTTRVSSYLLLWGIPPSVTAIPLGGATAGPWSIGPNKDGTTLGYTSPCSKGSGTREYSIVLYALSETPATLPDHSSLEVTYDVLISAISTVRVLGTATLTFTDTTP